MRYLFLMFCFCTSLVFASDVAVVTLAIGDEYKAIVKDGIESKRLYCERHGYDFICGQENLDPSRPLPWSKIKILQKVMENPNYKWIFWTDADSLIMNQAIKLEDLIDEKYNFIVTKDPNAMNTGQFFIKNCAWSRDLLVKVYNDHPDCIEHCWWENMAFINEFKKDPSYWDCIKVIPQRLMNSYAPEFFGTNLTVCYQPGDFIIHFPGCRGEMLAQSLRTYAAKITCDPQAMALDWYHGVYGFKLHPMHSTNNEGFMTNTQKEQFQNQLARYPNIKSILEIGLNGGHSAENFLRCCKNVERFLSFDIDMHAYTKVAVEYFKRTVGDRFVFVKGDSAIEVPKYATAHPEEKYDLIYIDGNHEAQACRNDLVNCKAFAHKDTIVWLDDYGASWIKEVVAKLAQEGVLVIDQVFSSNGDGGGRDWVQLHYTSHVEQPAKPIEDKPAQV